MGFHVNTALVSLAISSLASASFSGNLNYLSPSKRHIALGVNAEKLTKRALRSPYDPSEVRFTHSVASGDPNENSVILWTRASPLEGSSDSVITVSGTAPMYDHDNSKYVEASSKTVCVEWKVASDEKMRRTVKKGTVWTSYEVDWTVKVEANGLKPFTTYYYQFNVCNSKNASPIGRTKTTPKKNSSIKEIGLAVFSCSNFPQGFFNAYGNSARKDKVDYVLHLGDYIYEYKEGGYGWGWNMSRVPQPANRITQTLLDYRQRFASYRTDADLLESHRLFPWITVWDDHEIENNSWKAGTPKLAYDGSDLTRTGGFTFDQQKANAVRAYFEWLPIRQTDMDDNLRIWRDFSFGNLVDLIMLDTRNYQRDITDYNSNRGYLDKIRDEQGRSLLGVQQENWFFRKLRESFSRRAKWRVVGQQVIFAGVNYGDRPQTPYNADAWDGYRASKNRTLATIADNKIDNTIFLAGDAHASYVSDIIYKDVLPYDPLTGKGALGVEFAGTGVTSPGPVGQNGTFDASLPIAQFFVSNSQELQWQESYYRGYYELRFRRDKVTAEYFGVPHIRTRNGKEIKLAEFEVRDGENRLRRGKGNVPAVGKVVAGALKNGEVDVDGRVEVDTMKGKK